MKWLIIFVFFVLLLFSIGMYVTKQSEKDCIFTCEDYGLDYLYNNREGYHTCYCADSNGDIVEKVKMDDN